MPIYYCYIEHGDDLKKWSESVFWADDIKSAQEKFFEKNKALAVGSVASFFECDMTKFNLDFQLTEPVTRSEYRKALTDIFDEYQNCSTNIIYLERKDNGLWEEFKCSEK